MKLNFPRAALLLSSAVFCSLAAPVLAQDQTFTMTVTDSDFAYGTPGYTFRVIPITVTNAAGFRVDAIAVSNTGAGTITIVDFIIFTQGATIPTGGASNFGTHAADANAAGAFFDLNPGGVDPGFMLMPGAAGPLANGDYQLVVAPFDSAGTGGDVTVTFDLYGVFSPLFGAPPAAGNDLQTMLAASGGAARLLVVDSNGVVRKMGKVSLSTRDSLRRDSVRNGPTITASTKGTGFNGEVYTWAEIRGFRAAQSDVGTAHVEGNGLALGADIAIGPDMVAGLSLGYSDITGGDAGTTQAGSYTYLQPYTSYRSGNWSGTASLIYGVGDFEQVSAGGIGTSDVTLTALSFEGGYDIETGSNLTVTPTIGLIHGRETSTGTSGTLAGTTGVTRFTQASIGANVTRSGPQGSFTLGAHLDWLEQDGSLALASQFIAEDGVTGRISLGGETDIGNGMKLSSAFEVGGLGGNTESYNGGIRIALRF